MSWVSLRRAAAALAASMAVACASGRTPAPVKPPDEVETLVASLAKELALDAIQQERTREFARELVARYAALRASWDRGGRVRPQELLASRARFEAEFSSILTDMQRRKLREDLLRLRLKALEPPPFG